MTTLVRSWLRGAAVAALVLLADAPARAVLVSCEGRCEDGAGNVMTVENRCDDVAERCVAGCDTSGPRPAPYAECEATGRGKVPPPPPPEDPGGVRERDGD